MCNLSLNSDVYDLQFAILINFFGILNISLEKLYIQSLKETSAVVFEEKLEKL